MTWYRWLPGFLETRNILKNPNLYLIGLTGGIACGKSTVLAMLSSLGARTIDADRVTHRVQQPVLPFIVRLWPPLGPIF